MSRGGYRNVRADHAFHEMGLPAHVVRNTRTLLVATGVAAAGFALPLLLGEAAWAFGLLVAPILLVAICALPVAIWASTRAVASVMAGDDPRRWVLVLSVVVILAALFLIFAIAFRFQSGSHR